MRKIYNLFSVTNIPQLLPYCFMATLLTTSLALISDNLSAKAAESFTVSATEVTSYAQAILGMEPQRQEAFKNIKELINNQEIPKMVCNLSDSIINLPDKARNIAVNYCKNSQQIVKHTGLTIERFNQITQEIQGNKILREQIYNELIRQQKQSGSQ